MIAKIVEMFYKSLPYSFKQGSEVI